VRTEPKFCFKLDVVWRQTSIHGGSCVMRGALESAIRACRLIQATVATGDVEPVQIFAAKRNSAGHVKGQGRAVNQVAVR